MYEKNYDILKQIVEEHAVIRHVSKHRKPDGSFDLEGNRKIWNDALDRLETMKLWENGTPGYDPEKDRHWPSFRTERAGHRGAPSLWHRAAALNPSPDARG